MKMLLINLNLSIVFLFYIYSKYYSYSERSESIESEEITSSLSSSKNSDSSEAYKIKVNDMQNDNISIEDIVNLSKSKIKIESFDWFLCSQKEDILTRFSW